LLALAAPAYRGSAEIARGAQGRLDEALTAECDPRSQNSEEDDDEGHTSTGIHAALVPCKSYLHRAKGAVSVENFFKGCKTEQEKHDRVAAAFPDAYKAKPSG
jgi:hypothetical protein